MKLSARTLQILNNFATINDGICFKKGTQIDACSGSKSIRATAKIDETIPTDFAIYELGNLLSVLSMYEESPDLEFEDKQLVITGYEKGRSKTRYRYTDPTMITWSDKIPNLPSKDVAFQLPSKDLAVVLKSAAILKTPQITIESDGKKVYIATVNMKDDSKSTNHLEIGPNKNKNSYRIVFATENLKLLPDDYDVEVSGKAFAKLVGKNLGVTYYIAVENNSKYGDK
jgi:hypothetical protein